MMNARLPVLFLAAVLLACAQAHAGDREDPADAQSSAIEIAMSIGQLQALAELCAAPEWSYEKQLNNATYLLPRIYGDAGLKADEADGDVGAGRRAEVSRRQEASWPLDCNRFRHQVSYVVGRAAQAAGQTPAPLLPVDAPDWRDHPDAEAAVADAMPASPVAQAVRDTPGMITNLPNGAQPAATPSEVITSQPPAAPPEVTSSSDPEPVAKEDLP